MPEPNEVFSPLNKIVKSTTALSALHSTLLENGYDITEDKNQFAKSIADEPTRKNLFNALKQGGFDITDDFDEFSQSIGYVKKKDNSPSLDTPSQSKKTDNFGEPTVYPKVEGIADFKGFTLEQQTKLNKDALQRNDKLLVDPVINHFTGPLSTEVDTPYQKPIKITYQDYITDQKAPKPLSAYLQSKGVSRTTLGLPEATEDTPDEFVSKEMRGLFDFKLKKVSDYYLDPTRELKDFVVTPNDDPYTVNLKNYAHQAWTNREANPILSPLLGTAKLIIGGVKRSVIDPTWGVANIISDALIGIGVPPPPKILSNESISKGMDYIPVLGDIWNRYEDMNRNIPDLPEGDPNTFGGKMEKIANTVLGGAAILPGMMVGMNIGIGLTGGIRAGKTGLTMAGYVGGEEFLNKYNELSKEGMPVVDKLKSSTAAGIEGAVQGMAMEGITTGSPYVAANLSAKRALGKEVWATADNATKTAARDLAQAKGEGWWTAKMMGFLGWGSLDLVSQYMQNKYIDPYVAVGNGLFGGVVTEAGKHKAQGIDISSEAIGKKYDHWLQTTPAESKLISKIKTPLREMRQAASKMAEKAVDPKDITVEQNEDGTHNITANFNLETKSQQQLNSLGIGELLTKIANAKEISDDVAARPQFYIDKTNESFNNGDTQPWERDIMLEKIKQDIANHDPINIKSEPIAKEIDVLNQEIADIENGADAPIVKKLKIEVKNKLIKEKEAQITEIINPTVAEPVKTETSSEVSTKNADETDAQKGLLEQQKVATGEQPSATLDELQKEREQKLLEAEQDAEREIKTNKITPDKQKTVEVSLDYRKKLINEAYDKKVAELKSEPVGDNTTPTEKQSIIDEINSKPLTHAEDLGMGSNEMEGTYISTEKTNRYSDKAKPVKANVENPYVLKDSSELIDLQNSVLEKAKEEYAKSNPSVKSDEDFNNAKSFDDDVFMDYPDFQNYVAKEVTTKLKADGYDSVYQREGKDSEGMLVVFDKSKVNGIKELSPEEIKLSQQEETDTLLSGGAEQNRKNGSYTKDGTTYTRQEPQEGIKGTSGKVEFTNQESVPFTYKLVEAETLQPSHQGGIRNPNHFVPEMQPKNRNDKGSIAAEFSFANHPRGEKLGESTDAYSGAPIVNERNEVVQGNNRGSGLKKGYDLGNKEYRQWLHDNAEKFGLTKEQVDNMKSPILTREIKVTDEKGIELGNYDVKDLETGGKRRVNPITTTARMPQSKMAEIAELLFKDDTKTLNDAIRINSKKVFAILNQYLNPSERNSMIKDGELTQSGVEDIESVIKHFLYKNGDIDLPDMYEGLSYVRREGIRKSLPKLLSVDTKNSLIPDIQNAIIAVNNFAKSGFDNMKGWLNKIDLFTGKIPTDIYSPLELKLAEILINAKKQEDITKAISEYTELVKGKEADMFEPKVEPISKQEAVKQLFQNENTTENVTQRKSTAGPKQASGTEGTKKTEPKITESKTEQNLRDLASKLREGKINKPGRFQMATPASLVWDGAIEVVAKALETGANLVEASRKGLDYIRNTDWYKGESDKEGIEKDFLSAIKEPVPEGRKASGVYRNSFKNISDEAVEFTKDTGYEPKSLEGMKIVAEKAIEQAGGVDKAYDMAIKPITNLKDGAYMVPIRGQIVAEFSNRVSEMLKKGEDTTELLEKINKVAEIMFEEGAYAGQIGAAHRLLAYFNPDMVVHDLVEKRKLVNNTKLEEYTKIAKELVSKRKDSYEKAIDRADKRLRQIHNESPNVKKDRAIKIKEADELVKKGLDIWKNSAKKLNDLGGASADAIIGARYIAEGLAKKGYYEVGRLVEELNKLAKTHGIDFSKNQEELNKIAKEEIDKSTAGKVEKLINPTPKEKKEFKETLTGKYRDLMNNVKKGDVTKLVDDFINSLDLGKEESDKLREKLLVEATKVREEYNLSVQEKEAIKQAEKDKKQAEREQAKTEKQIAEWKAKYEAIPTEEQFNQSIVDELMSAIESNGLSKPKSTAKKTVSGDYNQFKKELKKIVRDSQTGSKSRKDELVKKFVDELGLDKPSAEKMYDVLKQQADRLYDEEKELFLSSKFSKPERLVSKVGKAFDKLAKNIELGIFDENYEKFSKEISDMYGLREMTPKEVAELRKAITDAHEARNTKYAEHFAFEASKIWGKYMPPESLLIKGVKDHLGISYAFMFSGVTTQRVNLESNANQLLAEQYTQILSPERWVNWLQRIGNSGRGNKGKAAMTSPIQDFFYSIASYGLSLKKASAVLGRVLTKGGTNFDKFNESNSAKGLFSQNVPRLEQPRYEGGQHFKPIMIGKANVNIYEYAKYVFRALDGVDQAFRVLSRDLGTRKAIRNAEIKKDFTELSTIWNMGFSDTYLRGMSIEQRLEVSRRLQKDNELYYSLSGKMPNKAQIAEARASIIEDMLSKRLPDDVVVEIKQESERGVFQRGGGIFTTIGDNLATFKGKSVGLQVATMPYIPVTHIVGRLFDMGLDYAGFGLTRSLGLSPTSILGKYFPKYIKRAQAGTWKSEAAKKQRDRGFFGLFVYSVLGGLLINNEDKDKFAITGSMRYSDSQASNRLQTPPHTVKFMGQNINYMSFPPLIGLALLGEISDMNEAGKFKQAGVNPSLLEIKDRDEANAWLSLYFEASMKSFANVFRDQSLLQGVVKLTSDITEAIGKPEYRPDQALGQYANVTDIPKATKEKSGKVLKSLTASYGGLLTQPLPTRINLLQQAVKFVDPTQREKVTATDIWMYNLGVQKYVNRPSLDIFGEPTESLPGTTQNFYPRKVNPELELLQKAYYWPEKIDGYAWYKVLTDKGLYRGQLEDETIYDLRVVAGQKFKNFVIEYTKDQSQVEKDMKEVVTKMSATGPVTKTIAQIKLANFWSASKKLGLVELGKGNYNEFEKLIKP